MTSTKELSIFVSMNTIVRVLGSWLHSSLQTTQHPTRTTTPPSPPKLSNVTTTSKIWEIIGFALSCWICFWKNKHNFGFWDLSISRWHSLLEFVTRWKWQFVCLAYSVPRFMIAWPRKVPGHQLIWYWPIYPGIFRFQYQRFHNISNGLKQ